MKTIASGLVTNLYGQNIHVVADLYTFTFDYGTERWTSAARDVVSASLTWSCSGPEIERDSTRSSAGFEVDELAITLHPGSGTVAGLPMAEAAVAGEFDNVPVRLDRAFFDQTGSLVGTIRLFDGTAVEVAPGSTSVELKVKSAVSRMKNLVPRRVYQAQCPFNVYDSDCGVSSGSFVHTRTIAAGSTTSVINLSSASSMAVPGSWIEVTSGAVSGEKRLVVGASGASITLQKELGGIPATGDGVRVVRGCDRTRGTCRNVFGNNARFGGYPDATDPRTVSNLNINLI